MKIIKFIILSILILIGLNILLGGDTQSKTPKNKK